MEIRVRSYAMRCRLHNAAMIAGMSMLMSAGSAGAAVNAYLLVDGIDGPSTSKAHAIDVLSFSEGVGRVVVAATPAASSHAPSVQKLACSDLSIMKVVDSASVALLQAAFSGAPIASVTLLYDKPVGDKQQTYFSITLSNAIVTSVQESGSNENPTESVSFAASAYTFSYSPQKDDGSLGNPIVFKGSCPS